MKTKQDIIKEVFGAIPSHWTFGNELLKNLVEEAMDRYAKEVQEEQIKFCEETTHFTNNYDSSWRVVNNDFTHAERVIK